MVALIDTMVLIWWVRRQCTDGQEEMLKRAAWLMEDLESLHAHVMISSVSLAEFLKGSTPKEQGEQLLIIEKTFLCMPFDQRTALILATKSDRVADLTDYEKRRVAYKADQMIVATAIANKADIIYSHDARLRKLACALGIEARDLPDIAPTLFHA